MFFSWSYWNRSLFLLFLTCFCLTISLYSPKLFCQELEVPSKPKKELFKTGKKKRPKKFCKNLSKILDDGYKDVIKANEILLKEFKQKKDDEELPIWQLDRSVIWEEDQFQQVYAPHPSPDGQWVSYLSQSLGNDIKTTIIISKMDRTALVPVITSSELMVYRQKRRSDYCFKLDAGFTWSANGKILAFMAKQLDNVDLFFLVLPVGKKGKMQLWQATDDETVEFQPAFSPTNEYFAYVCNTNGIYNVQLVTLDDWHVKPMGIEGRSATFSPDFHPTENQLVYVRENLGVYSIILRNIKSDKEMRLVDSLLSPYIFPTWSPDGKLIAFYDSESIKSVDISSNIEILCTDALNPSEHEFLDRIAWLPNSKQVIYTRKDKRIKTLYVSMNDERGSLLARTSTTNMLTQTTPFGKTIYYGGHQKQWKIYNGDINLYIPKPEDISTHSDMIVYKAAFTGNAMLKDEKKRKLKDISNEKPSGVEIEIAEIRLLEPASVSEENIIELIETDEKKHFISQISLRMDDIVNKTELYVRLNSRIAKPKRKLTLSYSESAVGGGPGGATK